jgi:hypothetical protein
MQGYHRWFAMQQGSRPTGVTERLSGATFFFFVSHQDAQKVPKKVQL